MSFTDSTGDLLLHVASLFDFPSCGGGQEILNEGSAGDYYNEPDDCTRSVRLVGFTGAEASREAVDRLGCLPLDMNIVDCSNVDGVVVKGNDQWCACGCGDTIEDATPPLEFKGVFLFSDTEIPPPLPEDPAFQLLRSSVRMTGVSPAMVVNSLLCCLRKQKATVTKVNRKKFSIEARAVMHSESCIVKIRIYGEAAGCAVEFSRRSGDGLVFSGIFRIVRDVLCAMSTSNVQVPMNRPDLQ